MIDSEKQEFLETVGAILQVHGRPANAAVLQVWWGALQAWPLDEVKTALGMFVRDGGNPIPASIVALLPDPLGHPTQEDAWNAAQKDENTEGAYMSHEMLCAVCAASDSISRGDMIGARKCFLEVYAEKVKEAKREARRPSFRYFAPIAVTNDQKKEIEAAAIQNAITRRWLPSEYGQLLLERVQDEMKRLELN